MATDTDPEKEATGSDKTTGEQAVAALMRILTLEGVEENLFRGHSPDVGWQRVFGGQVLGQALMAACRTVEESRFPHSLHGYFMRPGDPSVPILYEVDPIRDGRSFTTRRVIGIQHGEAIFSMGVSFHIHEDGFDHQSQMPDVPPPEKLIGEDEMKKTFMEVAPEPVKQYWKRERPLELRPVSLAHYLSNKPLPPEQNVWMRATAPLVDDPHVHAAVLAYASDMTLLDTALFPHGKSIFSRSVQPASLDHAMWFHRPFRVDDWLLYAQDTPSASGARGFTRGAIYTRDGRLVASCAQEGLIRRIDPDRRC